MRPRASPLAGAWLTLALLTAPPVAHFALIMHRGMGLAGILLAVQAAMVVWILWPKAAPRWLRMVMSSTACLGVWLVLRSIEDGPAIAAGVPHAMIYLALLALFAASLRLPREAIVTTFARRARGHLPAEVVLYTRRITWLWTGFFAVQLLTSLLLLLFAPFDIWSLFINLCNLPMIGALLCAEYAYRRWRHATNPPERLRDMIRVFRGIRPWPISEAR